MGSRAAERKFCNRAARLGPWVLAIAGVATAVRAGTAPLPAPAGPPTIDPPAAQVKSDSPEPMTVTTDPVVDRLLRPEPPLAPDPSPLPADPAAGAAEPKPPPRQVIEDPLPPAVWSGLGMFAAGGLISSFRKLRRFLT